MTTVREDVVVLEQQEVLLAAVVEQRLLYRERLAVRHPPQPADTEGAAHHNSADQSRLSRIALTFLRKPAA